MIYHTVSPPKICKFTSVVHLGLCPYTGSAKRLRHDLLFSQYLQVRHEASEMVMKAITINFCKLLCVK